MSLPKIFFKFSISSSLLLGFALGAPAQADDERRGPTPKPCDSYRIDAKRSLRLCTLQPHLKINEDCAQGPAKKLTCLAFKATQKASLFGIDEVDTAGGKDPGSPICKKLAGHAVIATDDERNQEALCLFNDKSAIVMSALYYFARLNDESP